MNLEEWYKQKEFRQREMNILFCKDILNSRDIAQIRDKASLKLKTNRKGSSWKV